MPTGINYLNPQAFMPQNEFKADGLLGGYLYGQQMDDYRKIMEVQHYLQQLGAQRAGQEHTEYMQGADLRKSKADLERETVGGQLPHARQTAGEIMQNQGAQAGRERQTINSPGAINQYFLDMKNKKDDRAWEMTKRELTIGADVAHQATQIAQTQGEAAAIGFVQQKLQQAKQMGINLPEQQFMNPQGWQGIVSAARNSIAQMQKLDQLNVQGQYDLEGRRISGQYGIQAAQERARSAAADRPPTESQEKARARRVIADRNASPEDKEEARQILRSYVDPTINKEISDRWMELMNGRVTPDDIRYEAEVRHGIREREYEKGKPYTFKTRDGKTVTKTYKGGDPSNQKNWK